MGALPKGLLRERYQLEELLGAGGMGEVYRARDLTLNRVVAVKILSRDLTAHATRRARFEREARLIAALNHPHVCTLHDFGYEDGVSFLVLEYLEGQALSQIIAQGLRTQSGSGSRPGALLPSSLSLKQVLTWGAQMADALAAAHRQGIVHRDLKPDNVVVVSSGVKLLDFGLARQSDSDDGASPPTPLARSVAITAKIVSAENALIGTLPYMAPEQFEGRPADARSDIFALGLVLYEMVAGKRAFEAASEAALISAIVERTPPSLSSVSPLVPAALDALVRECLAKDPEERWQSAADIARILRQLASDPSAGVAARSTRMRVPRRPLAIAGAAVMAFGLGFALRPRVTARTSEVAQVRTIAFEANVPTLYGHPRISPDGTQLLVTTEGDGSVRSLLVRPLRSTTMIPLPGTEGARFPFWSPDGREVAFASGGKLRRVPASPDATRPPRVITEHPGPFIGGSWGARGTIVFAAGRHELFSVPAEGGTAVRLRGSAGDGSIVGEPVFLPDGRHFVVFQAPRDRSKRGVFLSSLDTPDRIRFLFPADTSAVWSAASGELIYGERCSLWGRRFVPEAGAVAGDAKLYVENLACDGFRGRPYHSVSPDGTLVFRQSSEQSVRLVWHDRAGAALGGMGPSAQYRNFDLSTDGRRLVVGRRSASTGALGIWVIDSQPDSTSELAKSPEGNDLGDPVWTYDGRQVLYSDPSHGTVLRQELVGGPPSVAYAVPNGMASMEDVSRDGRLLAYLHWSEVSQVVEVADLSTKAVRTVGPPSTRSDEAQFSPDGTLVAYNAAHVIDGGTWEIFVERTPPAEGRWQVSARGGVCPRWAADGKRLFYLSLDGRLMETTVTFARDGGLAFSEPQALFQTRLKPNGLYDQFAVSADGTRFLLPVATDDVKSSVVQVITGWAAGQVPHDPAR